jgi:hypothetical protein
LIVKSTLFPMFCHFSPPTFTYARCNGQIRDAGISLEGIETVIPPGDGLRWLPIEAIAKEAAEAFLASLDERCGIPKPRSIAQALVA